MKAFRASTPLSVEGAFPSTFPSSNLILRTPAEHESISCLIFDLLPRSLRFRKLTWIFQELLFSLLRPFQKLLFTLLRPFQKLLFTLLRPLFQELLFTLLRPPVQELSLFRPPFQELLFTLFRPPFQAILISLLSPILELFKRLLQKGSLVPPLRLSKGYTPFNKKTRLLHLPT